MTKYKINVNGSPYEVELEDSSNSVEFLSKKPLLITDTILRDAHQSQAATRMRLEDMLPAC